MGLLASLFKVIKLMQEKQKVPNSCSQLIDHLQVYIQYYWRVD